MYPGVSRVSDQVLMTIYLTGVPPTARGPGTGTGVPSQDSPLFSSLSDRLVVMDLFILPYPALCL